MDEAAFNRIADILSQTELFESAFAAHFAEVFPAAQVITSFSTEEQEQPFAIGITWTEGASTGILAPTAFGENEDAGFKGELAIRTRCLRQRMTRSQINRRVAEMRAAMARSILFKSAAFLKEWPETYSIVSFAFSGRNNITDDTSDVVELRYSFVVATQINPETKQSIWR